MSDFRVSVVIRSKNRQHTIRKAIESVQCQSIPVEILVVDSGSSDGTVEIAKSMDAKVIQIEPAEFTYGGAINRGVREASGELVLVLSSHCYLPTSDWVESALPLFEERRVAGLNGVSTYGFGDQELTLSSPLRALEIGMVAGKAVQKEQWFSFAGFSNHAALIRRSVALEFPFDEDMTACEDKEWANRVARNGFYLVYSSGHVVSGAHRRKEGFKALYLRGRKEALALARFAGYPIWTPRSYVQHSLAITASRRGLRRLAPLHPSNLVESAGRVGAGRSFRRGSDYSLTTIGKEVVSVVGKFNLPDGRVDLVNFPLHDNPGDSAIWLGQTALLEALGVSSRQRRSFSNVLGQYAPSSCAPTVLVRGGGYFGDLWRVEFESFHHACARYKGCRLIFMPQTIGTISQESLDRVRRSISLHGDVHLLVRDQRSLEFARREFPSTESTLCPDSAVVMSKAYLLGLAGEPPSGLPKRRVIARTDLESSGLLAERASARGIDVVDFLSSEQSRQNTLFRWSHEFVRARFPRYVARWLLAEVLPRTGVFELHARTELGRGLSLLVGAELIVTDRLHVSILSAILGTNVLVVDTGYGKLRAYFEAWPSPYVRFADSVDDALDALEEL